MAISFPLSILPSILLLALALVTSSYLFTTRHQSSLTPTEDIELHPELFYPQLRKRKLFTGVLVVLLLALSGWRIGWEAIAADVGHEIRWIGILDQILAASFCIITLSQVSRSLLLPASEIDRHWAYTVLLTITSFFALITTLITIIIPSDALNTHSTLAVTTLVLQTLTFIVVGTTPRCAPLIRASTSRPITQLPSSSPLSYLVFHWITPVLYFKDFTVESLPILAKSDRAEVQWEEIKNSEGVLEERRPKSLINPLLWRVLVVNSRLFVSQSVLALFAASIHFLPAFFLQRLVNFLEHLPEGGSLKWGYTYSLGLLGAGILNAVNQQMLWFVSNSTLATRIRVQLNCLVFDKTLKRKDVAGVASASRPSSISGDEGKPAKGDGGIFGEKDGEVDEFKSKSQVLNLFTIDVDRVAEFAMWSWSLIDAPCEILIGTVFLYKLLGYAAFVGISVAVLFVPLNHFTSKGFATVQDRLMSARDKRVSLMNEVLQSIRMIKYMAFELPFENRILEAREEELKHLRANFYLETTFNFIWATSPILCILTSFYTYTVVMQEELTPATAFASLAVWNELRFALNMIPDILVQAIQCLVSTRRIQKYLDSPEIADLAEGEVAVRQGTAISNGIEIACEAATVTWPTGSDKKAEFSATTNTFELQNLSLKFPARALSLVCGSLGSGKTLLLLALLGEADITAGKITCPHSTPDAISLPGIEWDALLTEENWIQANQTSFVPQSAWLQNASIRSNICFGLPYREKRYQATLAACSLVSDLAILEDGDRTEIGEKGINLSGGQKARVSLARAVYSRASVLLADDVLSAVDAHTSLHLFKECLKGPLMKGRTVILVSHHIQLTAPGAEYVVELDNGRVKFEGLATEFLQQERFKVAPEDDLIEEKALEFAKSPPKPKNRLLEELVTDSTLVSADTSSASEGEDDSDDEDEDDEETKDALEAPRKLIKDEERAIGQILFILVFVGTKVADVGQSFWINIWARSYAAVENGNIPRPVQYYLTVYAGLSFLTVIVTSLQSLVLYAGTLRASDALYRMLLHAILRAPLRFFDTQALGRIINRFARDFEGVDSQLPDHFRRTVQCALGVLTTLVVVASVSPPFLVVFGFLGAAYFYHGRLFSNASRELRRLDSVTKSPLYSIYGECIAGVTVIRAFGSSQRYRDLMLQIYTTNVTFYWYLWGVTRWLSVRFALLSALFIGLTGYSLIATHNTIDASLAGFALTFSLNISADMLFLVRRWVSLELAMVSVERIKEYSEVAPEAPEIIEPRPPAHWPSAGEIHVEDLTIRYAPELPNVLHELNFSVAPGQKVGIVGATGCGKSTLALSFFRFVEAHSGRIVIDGIDISKVGLKDLRSRITIIPQDPTILSGTLRSTLDIFDEYSDAEIFDSLRRVQLIRADGSASQGVAGSNRSPFYNLDAEVSEGGGNLSQGQRQLLCMARALLRRTKIQLMDEATASVDYATDELITAALRQEFSDSTLLVIAHRLRTIIDFDKVLVLDAGRIVEYDKPLTLLENPSSRFYALCRATGKTEFRILKKMAEGKTRATHKPRKIVRRPSKISKTEAGAPSL